MKKDMSNKLDLATLEQYSQQYATKVCDEFFARNECINGQQILNLSTVGQVNLLIISELYEKWKADSLAFRSPFFDFEHEKVQAAMQTFMNMVSLHISAKREHFEPLFANATAHTLLLLLEPQQYFGGLIRDMPNFNLSNEAIKSLVKYTRIHKFIPEFFATKMGDEPSVYTSQALQWLEEIMTDASIESPEKYLSLFSEKIPLSKENLYKKQPAEEQSFFDTIAHHTPEPSTSYTPPPAIEPVAIAEPRISMRMEMHNESSNGQITEEISTLNDSFNNEQETIHEALGQQIEGTSLANYHQNSPVKSIADAISLSQRFLFIHQLFHGDSVAFNHAIRELDFCMSFDEAKDLMNRKFAPKYLWKMSTDEADQFFEIVKRKF